MTVPRTDKYHVYLADMMIAMMTMMMVQSNESDLEFVTSGTNGTCVKCFRARVKFSRIYATNYQFRELLQNNWTEFVLEWMIAQKLTICSKEMSK